MTAMTIWRPLSWLLSAALVLALGGSVAEAQRGQRGRGPAVKPIKGAGQQQSLRRGAPAGQGQNQLGRRARVTSSQEPAGRARAAVSPRPQRQARRAEQTTAELAPARARSGLVRVAVTMVLAAVIGASSMFAFTHVGDLMDTSIQPPSVTAPVEIDSPSTGPPSTGPPSTGPPSTGPPSTGPPSTGPPSTGESLRTLSPSSMRGQR
jgi:hypothetical protein